MKPCLKTLFPGLLLLLLMACAPAVTPAPTLSPSPSPNLPPTSTPLPLPTATATLRPTPTDQANCYDSALYVADVTIPDNTKLDPGAAFTKTWQLKNTGTCTWNERYSLAYIGGERMDSPVTVPLAETAPGQSLDISVALTAPVFTGTFTGLFAIHDPQGRPITIGSLTSIWLKIRVENGTPLPQAASGRVAAGTPLPPKGGGLASCSYSENAGYVSELIGLINAARAEAKLSPLMLNGALSAAARAHSLDMGCNNFLEHRGSDGSWIGDRLSAAGYSTYHYTEIIAIGSPQEAMIQWRNSASHWEAVLDATMSDFGVGYVYVAGSNFGGYFTVDLAAP